MSSFILPAAQLGPGFIGDKVYIRMNCQGLFGFWCSDLTSLVQKD